MRIINVTNIFNLLNFRLHRLVLKWAVFGKEALILKPYLSVLFRDQRSCQRNENILENGYCQGCNEAVKDTTAQLVEKNKTNDADLKDLLSIHEDITSGKVVDQNVMNGLMIGVIVKIIAGHDAFKKELDTKIDQLEKENTTSQYRIESLETWINKQDETIMKMRDEKRLEDLMLITGWIRMHHLTESLEDLQLVLREVFNQLWIWVPQEKST